MSFPKILMMVSLFLFGAIILVFIFKKEGDLPTSQKLGEIQEPIEIDLTERVDEVPQSPKTIEDLSIQESSKVDPFEIQLVEDQNLPTVDRIKELFVKNGSKLPIVETITYKSHVPWHPGKSAWLADYASHYKTSRHFIARSLNGIPNYEKQEVKEGDKFNVLRKDKDFEFYLLVDLLANKMWFYYLDKDNNQRVLLKTYQVVVGRPDSSKTSGYLTPMGKYKLGNKVAVYRPTMRGTYQGEKVEMVRVFGTRWLPFAEELSDATEPAKGLGIHGLPLLPGERGEYSENLESLGKHESDGCIRMATKDAEELFSIVISRPTTVELVKGFLNAKLPGQEK